MPEPYSPQMPAAESYAEPSAYAADDDEEYEEEADDETAGGGFASLAGTRISRDVEGRPVGSDDEWGEGEGYEADGSQSDTADESDEALELTMEAGEQPAAEPQGPQDELLLDADRLAEADQPVQPAGGRRRRMLGAGGDDDEQASAPSRPASGGSTLFERMANLSRAGTSSSDDDDEEGEGSSSLRIPRFLGRQNNQ